MSTTLKPEERIVFSMPPHPITTATPHNLRLSQRWITWLSLLISALALLATTVGISTANGVAHSAFTSPRGESVAMQGGGLYTHESVSGAAQAIGQDYVTLTVAIPLLLIATVFAARGALRGKILQTGALWYFAYTYLLMAF